jgi:hypothetical protein
LRNILVQTGPGGFALGLHAWTDRVLAESDRNLFFRADGGDVTVKILDTEEVFGLERWRRMGYDRSSVVGDPLLVSLEDGGYQLRPESPAFRLGFQALVVPRTRWDRAAGP